MGAKVAIVAGGGGPTGRATAMALAASGLSVVAVDRSEAGLGDLPDGVRPEVADTTDPAVTADLVDRIGIRVNAVAPQLIDTPANRAWVPADMLAHAVSPEAIAAVIAFLVSDAAAPVSGAILPAYGTWPTGPAVR